MTNNKERIVYQTMLALSKKDIDVAYRYIKAVLEEDLFGRHEEDDWLINILLKQIEDIRGEV